MRHLPSHYWCQSFFSAKKELTPIISGEKRTITFPKNFCDAVRVSSDGAGPSGITRTGAPLGIATIEGPAHDEALGAIGLGAARRRSPC